MGWRRWWTYRCAEGEVVDVLKFKLLPRRTAKRVSGILEILGFKASISVSSDKEFGSNSCSGS